MQNFIENLKWRGMIHDMIPGTEEQLMKEMNSGYIGYDSTAPSLHIGNLATIMLLKHFQLAGHKPYAIVGGATTMVGDPGGKKEERQLINEEIINNNLKGIKKQLEKFLDFDCGKNSAEILNNYDWFKEFSFLDFLREAGKHITVGYMINKESVKRRLETGISFAEFSYQLLQGYDFYHLHKTMGVKLQMGGSDQWGNLTTGTELIRRKSGGEAFAITTPLITKADGTKFGKSESGAIWLDPELTSPYKFYQFWLNCADEDVQKLIKVFSLLSKQEIDLLIKEHNLSPHKRLLQKTLAKEVTIRVHSKKEYENSIKASDILFGKNTEEGLSDLDEKTFLDIFEGVPKIEISKSEFTNISNITELLFSFSEGIIFKSKGEARKNIQNGAVSINKIKVLDPNKNMNIKLLKDKYLLIQRGKKNYFIFIISDNK